MRRNFLNLALTAAVFSVFSCGTDDKKENNNSDDGGNNNGGTNNLAMNTWLIADDPSDSAAWEDTLYTSDATDYSSSSNMISFNDLSEMRSIVFTFSGTTLPATGTYALTNVLATGGAEPVSSGKVQIMGTGTGGIVSIGEGSVSITNEGGVITIVGTNIPVKTFSGVKRKLSLKLKYDNH